jgi:hypothetical protein
MGAATDPLDEGAGSLEVALEEHAVASVPATKATPNQGPRGLRRACAAPPAGADAVGRLARVVDDLGDIGRRMRRRA